MKILGVDSSGLTASVSVYEDGKIIAVNSVNNNKTHSQTLLPMIDYVMKQAELEPEELDAIATACGPGSFTGLRIGAATVKGLSLALDIPVIPVSTLEGLAYNAVGMYGIVCPVMDARRGQVYTAAYRFKGDSYEEIISKRAVPVGELADELDALRGDKRIIFLGDGVNVHEEFIREHFGENAYIVLPHHRLQDASSVAVLGAMLFKDGKYVSGDAFEPEYLRLSQAERERLEKEKP